MKVYNKGCFAGFQFSTQETYDWAHRNGSSWPCSTLSDNRLYVEFSVTNGDLVEFQLNGRQADCDTHELNAFCEDMIGASHPTIAFLKQKFPKKFKA